MDTRHIRRRTLLTGAAALAAAPFAAWAQAEATTGFPALKRIEAGLLSVEYAELGDPAGAPVLLLHGWPYDIHSYVDVAPALAAAGHRVIVPFARGYGGTRFLSAQAVRNGQPAALAQDAIDFMDALGIRRAVIGGFDWGARTACIIAALWPERCAGLVSVSGYLLVDRAVNLQPLPPQGELAWWYQFYFATERGRAGYEKYTADFNRLIWQQASPQWKFDEATWQRSAPAFRNPDHVAITIHNYRWRLSLADGQPRYDAIEARIATTPAIRVPAITLEGDANGAAHAAPATYARRFTGPYDHRDLTGGIGHNLPQEAPRAFTQAILDVAQMQR